MRSISFSALARTLAAALFLVVLATGAQAQTAGGASGAAAASSSGPSGGSIRRSAEDPNGCGGGLVFGAPPTFGEASDAVKELSRATQVYIKECRCVTQDCVADALDQYAQALAALAPRLPKELQETPEIVARAARRVRAAKTKAEAVKALNQAAALIHKDMTLVRAEEPDAQQRQTRSGVFVVDTLNVASLSLEKGGAL
jgi:hypothetical protein